MSQRRELLPLVQEALRDDYRVIREIGQGGAAKVFLAENAAGEQVALKVLHPQLAVSVQADRFLREIRLLSQINHPNIAGFIEGGERDWMVFYVMDYIEGPTLKQHLSRARKLTIEDTYHVAHDVLRALTYAHGMGIVHRDVKPENIVLSREGAVLLDFGIARAMTAAGSDRVTRSGFVVGTSTYMSPEQVAGSEELDLRSDIYSTGCVLFECLAGRPPFVHQREDVVLVMQQNQPAPSVTEFRDNVPDDLVHAVSKALSKNLNDRWDSAAEMEAVLSH